jgi:hypothetical protein
MDEDQAFDKYVINLKNPYKYKSRRENPNSDQKCLLKTSS